MAAYGLGVRYTFLFWVDVFGVISLCLDHTLISDSVEVFLNTQLQHPDLQRVPVYVRLLTNRTWPLPERHTGLKCVAHKILNNLFASCSLHVAAP